MKVNGNIRAGVIANRFDREMFRNQRILHSFQQVELDSFGCIPFKITGNFDRLKKLHPRQILA